MIKIGKPYIKTAEKRTKLVAHVKASDMEKDFFFEVDDIYEKYLCTEVSDAFVVGLLNYAMAKGESIISDAPVSSRLLYQLRTYFIPTLKEVRPSTYKEIEIIAEESRALFENAGAVGTSASGGVDSFYSITKHMHGVPERYKLTYLLIANQFNFYGGDSEVRQQFSELINDTKKIPDHYKLNFITMFTNHYEFLFDGFVQEYSLRICSYALALQKLFGIYYVSSGVPFKEFGFDNHDSDGFDAFTLSLASTDMVTFYSSGGEIGRTEKIKFFSDDTFVQKNLKVCNYNEHTNCGTCEKCMRTMLSLDIIGKLYEFRESFPSNEFKKRKWKFLTVVEAGYLEASSDLIENMKRYKYQIPISSLILGRTIVRGVHNIKCLLKKMNWLRDLYYNLKLDFVVHGQKNAPIYRYGTKYEIGGK